ncbi:MAG: hypothetical protein ACRDHY_19975 [Anaerolineales bacterium]
MSGSPLGRIGSFVVTFHRPAALAKTLGALFDQTRPPEIVLVVDNGGGDAEGVVTGLGNPRVAYECTGSNLGSAGGVAFGMRALATRGFDWFHSVDDDDPPSSVDTLERLHALIQRHDNPRLGAVAAVGCNWDWATGQLRRIPDEALAGDLVVDVAGGGGQLTVRREVVEAIGTPDPRLFFGFYDPLYCLRMAQAGFEVLIDADLMRSYRLVHNRLSVRRSRSLVPKVEYAGTWRQYYVSRNYIYRMRNTFDRPDLARKEAARAAVRSAASWLRGPRYGAHFTALQARGVADGYLNRLGRRVEPMPKSLHRRPAGG